MVFAYRSGGLATEIAIGAPRVLVVEDEYLIAIEMVDLLLRLGCKTVGPAPSVAKAEQLIDDDAPDFALLDVDLGRERSTRVADLLMARRIPFALATAYDARHLPELSLRHALRISKPVTPDALQRLLGGFFTFRSVDAGT